MSSYTQSSRYQRCQSIFDRQYPAFRNAGLQYQDLVKAAVSSNTLLLDVGCGRDSLAAEAVRQTRVSVGMDRSLDDLPHNTLVTYCLGGDAGSIPFAANTFDVIISQWVVEHFDQPVTQFAEIARVLKPGGQLIIMTTNANNYIAWTGRLFPERLRTFVLTRLLRRSAHESFPTFYRANTRRALTRVGAQAGLRLARYAYVGNPFYLAFSVPLFRCAMVYERLTDMRALNHLKLYLLAVLQKDPHVAKK